LIYGVISLAARFSKHSVFTNIDPRERGRPYAKEAERLLDLHNTSLTTVQACVLMGAIQVVEMDSATESIFYTIACRMAMILDLPNAVSRSRLEQELNIRGDTIPALPIPGLFLTLLLISMVVCSSHRHMVVCGAKTSKGNTAAIRRQSAHGRARLCTTGCFGCSQPVWLKPVSGIMVRVVARCRDDQAQWHTARDQLAQRPGRLWVFKGPGLARCRGDFIHVS
jgi:hypothetical protein